MAVSQRKRRFVRRLAGYATNPLRVRVRTALGREQHYEIGGAPVVLPPDHNLPYYQRRDPSYDDYAVEVVRSLAHAVAPRTVHVVDLGANVGDTAVAMLTAATNVRVVAVEGSPRFAAYLERNLAGFGERAETVTAFVGPLGEGLTFSEASGTGGFQPWRAGTSAPVDWMTPESLLEAVEDDEVAVWKSDIDGFDIHLLAQHWAAIDRRSELIWFEFDPAGTLGDLGDVDRLCELLAGSGRVVRVYDNLGRPMLRIPPGPAVAEALTGLADWLRRQRVGHVMTPYVDVWAARPSVAEALEVEHEWR